MRAEKFKFMIDSDIFGVGDVGLMRNETGASKT